MSNTYTLWNLLEDKKTKNVMIPRIQRDYAQGRKGREYIRSAFLKEIRDHLLNRKALTLDFVYGNMESESFYPLDGQQRLTTLWLVHWYLAFQLDQLNERNKATLKKFSYQTRSSSIAFCEALCDKMSSSSNVTGRVSDFIRSQPWFFSKWMQDPTVSAMLRTISGENGLDDGGREDNIETIFGKDKQFLKDCWCKLTEQNLVTFELMTIGSEELPLSDDLYIKMNARGKPLSDFENLKADWVSYIRDKMPNDALSFSTLIDRDWTDVFWTYEVKEHGKSFNGKIDDVFFVFINRFVLNQIVLAPTGEDYQKRFDQLSGAGLGDRRDLNRDPNNDSLIKYEGFSAYGDNLGKDTLEKLKTIFEELKKPEVLEAVKKFGFIPQRDEKTKKVKKTEQKDRIYFHAVTLFLQFGNFDKTRFARWMRIVRNLTENSGVDNISRMIACLKMIDGLGRHLAENSWNVYEGVGSYIEMDVNDRLAEQWKEEKEKASKIVEDSSFEDEIIQAEEYGFFGFSIRFLYRDGDGKVDWSQFQSKFIIAATCFDKTSNDVPIKTIKRFLSVFEGFVDGGYFFTTIGYHARDNCWKRNILCEQKWTSQVHEFLQQSPKYNAKGVYRDFIESEAVERIGNGNKSHKFRYYYGGKIHCDHFPEYDIYVSDDKVARHRLLIKAPQIAISNETWSGCFIWGDLVEFSYQGNNYCLTGDNEIYLKTAPENRRQWMTSDVSELMKLLNQL